MFQSTPQKLFRPLSSLSHFKIHQPLPLNPRESKQLLNLLTTSFRQQLDREHGSLDADNEIKPESTPKNTLTTKRKRTNSQSGSIRPTDHHLHSILSNPLFARGSTKQAAKAPGLSRDPLDVFDEACARGLMTLEYARACLVAKKRAITQSSALSIADGMKDSGASAKVLKWMSDNGMIRAEVFLQRRAFIAILIEYVVAEGSGDIVWMWTKEAFQRNSIKLGRAEKQSERDLAVHLLHNLVKAQAASSLTLDSAYQTIAKAQVQLQRLDIKPRSFLSHAGCWLSHETCMRISNHLPATDTIYNLFIEAVPSFTACEDLHLAHLYLHHPTKPSASKAIKYLVKIESSTRSQSSTELKSPWRIISIGLDAAKLLLEQHQYVDAKWVMKFLQEKYPQELGLDAQTSRDYEMAKAEAYSLELLQSLNLT